MITTSELINIVWAHLQTTPLKTAINGSINRRRRPQNSNKEDVVINSLSANNEQLQDAVLNVNVFVPDQTHNIGGTVQQQPNNARLAQLEKIAIDSLEDITVKDGSRIITFDVQQANTYPDDESTQHFINIRLQFNNINF